MPKYDISRLKAEQDRFDARKENLMQVFIPFREDFLNRIGQFTQEAVERDLRDVEPPKILKDTDEILEAAFTLNAFDLVLTATDDAYLLDWDGELASKIFIYNAGREDLPPRVEVVVKESGEGSYTYYMRWFTNDGPRFIVDTRSVVEGAGEETAQSLIDHFYDFNSAWLELPSRQAMTDRKSKKLRLGFATPE